MILTSLSPWGGMEWSGRSRPPHDKSPAVPGDLHSHGRVIAEGRSEASLSLWSEAQRRLENSHEQT